MYCGKGLNFIRPLQFSGGTDLELL